MLPFPGFLCSPFVPFAKDAKVEIGVGGASITDAYRKYKMEEYAEIRKKAGSLRGYLASEASEASEEETCEEEEEEEGEGGEEEDDDESVDRYRPIDDGPENWRVALFQGGGCVFLNGSTTMLCGMTRGVPKPFEKYDTPRVIVRSRLLE